MQENLKRPLQRVAPPLAPSSPEKNSFGPFRPKSGSLRGATRDSAPAIDLIDGEALYALLKDLKVGVRVQLVEEVEIDEAFFKSI